MIVFGGIIYAKKGVITEISFTGNNIISSKELTKQLPFKKTGLINQIKYNSRIIKLSSIKLKHLYDSKGYIDAKIENHVEKDKDGSIHLKFNILEGNQYFVKNIQFYGNM